tara:strand:- start:266 stop:1324 length:1059 start_codon:yes stop_codon:yes gene_type:complete
MFDFSKKIPSLDGIRAFAVLLVLISHAGYGHIVPGGFGVTLFFFLSGYLITFLLLKEFKSHGKISKSNFFMRRALRILPPLFFVLLVFYGVDYLLKNSFSYDFLGVCSQLFFFYNYYEIFVGGDVLSGTGVLWSLAVEEHYYALFPFVFALIFSLDNRAPEKLFLWLLVFLVLLVFLWRCYLYFDLSITGDRIYFSTDTRVDSILFGAILSVLVYEKRIDDCSILYLRDYVCLFVALIMVLASFLIRDDAFRWTLRFTVQGLALIIFFYYAVFYSTNPIFRIFNWVPIQVIGVLSYTIYLVHAIFLHFLKEYMAMEEGLLLALCSFALSFFVALSMYIWVEKPFAAIKTKFN